MRRRDQRAPATTGGKVHRGATSDARRTAATRPISRRVAQGKGGNAVAFGSMSAPMTVHGWLRYEAFRRLLPSDVSTLLEIGIGTGGAAALLSRDFDYIGIEPDLASFQVASRRLPEAKIFNVPDQALALEEPVDAVCAFEVLEHLRDDVGALRRWRGFVRSGGYVLVSVPAGLRLGPTDVRQGHFRRYTHDLLERRMRDAGLGKVVVVSYGFPVGYPLRLASDVLALIRPRADTMVDRTAGSGRWMQPRNRSVRRLLAAPFVLSQRAFPRLGTGLIARGVITT